MVWSVFCVHSKLYCMLSLGSGGLKRHSGGRGEGGKPVCLSVRGKLLGNIRIVCKTRSFQYPVGNCMLVPCWKEGISLFGLKARS